MPAQYFHQIVAQNSLKTLQHPQFIMDHLPLYYLGAQGPNMMYYHRLLHLNPRSPLPAFGMQLHQDNPFQLIRQLLIHSHNSVNATAYTLGYLTHCATDRLVNPFIIAMTEKPSGECDVLAQRRLESQIDIWYYRRSDTMTVIPPFDSLKTLDDASHKDIAHFLIQAYDDAYDDHPLHEDVLYNTIDDMRLFGKRLYDPTGSKYNFLTSLENLLNKPGRITSWMTSPVIPGYDFLNQSHNLWKAPWDLRTAHYESIPDLMDKATQLAGQMMQCAIDYWIEECPIDAVEDIVGTYNMNGAPITG